MIVCLRARTLISSACRAILTAAVLTSTPAPRNSGCLNVNSSSLKYRSRDPVSPSSPPMRQSAPSVPPVGIFNVTSCPRPPRWYRWTARHGSDRDRGLK